MKTFEYDKIMKDAFDLFRKREELNDPYAFDKALDYAISKMKDSLKTEV